MKKDKLIWANRLKQDLIKELPAMSNWGEIFVPGLIDAQPAAEAVTLETHRQVMWERDVAIQQLEEHGIPFGGIAPDVVKVIRCKDCKYSGLYCFGSSTEERLACLTIEDDGFVRFAQAVEPDWYCAGGERRTDENPKETG